MSIKDYLKHFPSNKIKKLKNLKLRSASGHNLNVLGFTIMKAKRESDPREYALKMILIDSERTFFPLLGRSWLDILTPAWRNSLVNKTNLIVDHSVQFIEKRINEIKNEFSEIFKLSLEEPMENTRQKY